MCCDCSNKLGYPVYHGDDPCADDSGVDPTDRTQPNDDRFKSRDEMQKPTKKPANRPKADTMVDDSAEVTVPQLKAFLKDRGLSRSGRKEDLLRRAKAVDGVKGSAGAADKVMFCFSHCARPRTRTHAHAQCAHTHSHSPSQDEDGVTGSAEDSLKQADDEVMFCFSHCARPRTRAYARAQCAHTYSHSHSQDEELAAENSSASSSGDEEQNDHSEEVPSRQCAHNPPLPSKDDTHTHNITLGS